MTVLDVHRTDLGGGFVRHVVKLIAGDSREAEQVARRVSGVRPGPVWRTVITSNGRTRFVVEIDQLEEGAR